MSQFVETDPSRSSRSNVRSLIFKLNLAPHEVHLCCQYGDCTSICSQVILLTPSILKDERTENAISISFPSGGGRQGLICGTDLVCPPLFMETVGMMRFTHFSKIISQVTVLDKIVEPPHVVAKHFYSKRECQLAW